MKIRTLAAIATLAAAPALAACTSSDDTATTTSSASVTAPQFVTNARGAIEVNLGDPVIISDNAGKTVLQITNTRLDYTGCADQTADVTQAKFVATIKTGAVTTPEWLWASDFYYVDADGKVAQNADVARAADLTNPCTGSIQFINTPPNSTAEGSPTIVIPNVIRAIGYHLKAQGVDQRVEWKTTIVRASPSTTTATEVPDTTIDTPAPAPADTTTDYPRGTVPGEGQDPANGLPPEWDRDGNGMIDTDAPIGDGDCATPECITNGGN